MAAVLPPRAVTGSHTEGRRLGIDSVAPTIQGIEVSWDRIADLFPLDPDIAYLDHGAFGVAPEPVRRAQQRLRDEMGFNPTAFFTRGLYDRLAHTRRHVAAFLGADPDGSALIPNAWAATQIVLDALGLTAAATSPADDPRWTDRGRLATEAGLLVVDAHLPRSVRRDDEVVTAMGRHGRPGPGPGWAVHRPHHVADGDGVRVGADRRPPWHGARRTDYGGRGARARHGGGGRVRGIRAEASASAACPRVSVRAAPDHVAGRRGAIPGAGLQPLVRLLAADRRASRTQMRVRRDAGLRPRGSRLPTRPAFPAHPRRGPGSAGTTPNSPGYRAAGGGRGAGAAAPVPGTVVTRRQHAAGPAGR